MRKKNRHNPLNSSSLVIAISASLGALMATGVVTTAQAQEVRRGSGATMLEEIVVRARKREESSQDVPMAISAMSAEQLETLKVRDLTHLSVRLPNVALDDVGSTRGTANFSIRGLGINSSIPGIDPTVGLVVDGVYLGLNQGVLFDTFDLESIEVLRGPQGTLFGRNVTGGAVLLNSKKPGDEFELSLRTAVDQGPQGGPSSYLMGSVGGPVTDWFAARMTAYYNDDDGFIENEFDGKDIGAMEQTMLRPVVVLTPSEDLELILRYEYNKVEGDGPVGQSHTNGSGVPGFPVNHDRDNFDAAIDEPGFTDSDTHFVTAEANWDVPLGNGTVTNIFGWRDYEFEGLADVDSQPQWVFHARTWLDYNQVSNELRYNGLFGERFNVTTGVYYLSSDTEYHERRKMLGLLTGGVAPAAQFDGGIKVVPVVVDRKAGHARAVGMTLPHRAIALDLVVLIAQDKLQIL